MYVLRRGFVLTVIIAFVGISSAWAQRPANELQGTWKMVSQELVHPDSVVEQEDEWGPGHKILNSTHFAWGREREDGSEVLAGGGRYEYYPEKNLYIEHIQYHSEPDFVGETLEFKARVEGDTWYHIGELDEYKLREVWKRVDPDTIDQQYRPDTTQSAARDANEQ